MNESPRPPAPRPEEQGLSPLRPKDPLQEDDRAVLVQVRLPDDEREAEDSWEELAGLAISVGAVEVGRVQQNRRAPDRSTFLGKGRLQDVKTMCEEQDASLVIFGHDLSPAQGRNLELELGLRVVDRSQLIMDLFALRAQTHQARLQVELAQLVYTLPRLRRLWTHLDRYKGGVGMRGPGETQLETDRREIRRKIADRRRKLENIERHQQVQRSRRSDRFTVSLLGYTNAGKSTLFNRLTEADVLVENRPFSTLDTRTRLWQISKKCTVLLSDTIGFIHELPHHLIASFHATLAEALEADLLLHVVDGSRDNAGLLVRSVEEVLGQIGAADRPRLLVVNKVDAVQDRAVLGGLGVKSIILSARSGEGCDELAKIVTELSREGYQEVALRIPLSEGASLAQVEAQGIVLDRANENGAYIVRARIPPVLAGRLRRFVFEPS